MSKPRGYYFERLLRLLRPRSLRSPLADWLRLTLMWLVLAGTLPWIVSIMLIAWLSGNGEVLHRNWGEGFGWLYLAAVLVWVIPASAWSGYLIYRDRHEVDYSEDQWYD